MSQDEHVRSGGTGADDRPTENPLNDVQRSAGAADPGPISSRPLRLPARAFPPSPPAPFIRPDPSDRVDRRDLTADPRVWLVYALVFAIVGVSSLVIPFLWPSVYEGSRLWPFGALLLTISLATFLTDPPEMYELRNHVVIALIPATSALGVIAYRPSGLAPVAAAIFAGTYTAGRIKNRRLLAAHYAFGSIVMLVPFLFDIDRNTQLAIVSMIPAVWVLALCSVLILEAAEAQGEELAWLVRRDPLTGVGNRRLLDETLAAELPEHAARGHALSVIALDLNGFKAINDQIGHEAGDVLLQRVASALAVAVRDSDTVVRQGGDEFCVVLPRTGAEQAAMVRGAIEAALADIARGGPAVTSGIGIATFPADGADAETLLAVADERLSGSKPQTRPEPPVGAAAWSGAFEPSTQVEPVTASAGGFIRLSRNELAINRVVWLAIAGMITLYGALVLLCAVAFDDLPTTEVAAFGGVLVLIGAVASRSEPPAMRSPLNHLVIAVPYVSSVVFAFLAPEVSGAILGPLAFSGSLAAVRLVDRRLIVAHILAATTCLAVLVAFGEVDVPMLLALALSALILWGAAIGDIVYLEGAEHQGDQLEQLVRRDPLTGAGNRRLLAEELARQLPRHARTHRSLSVIALDLNGFKALNDEAGHAAGDEMLQRVAEVLSGLARDGDTVVRQGGDEFCLVLPDTSAGEAFPVARAVRDAVTRVGRGVFPVTTGIGIATYPADATEADVLLFIADERLRHDKQGPAAD